MKITEWEVIRKDSIKHLQKQIDLLAIIVILLVIWLFILQYQINTLYASQKLIVGSINEILDVLGFMIK